MCGRRAAWKRAVESRLHKPVALGPFAQDSSRYPYIIAQRNQTGQRQNFSHSFGGVFSSGSPSPWFRVPACQSGPRPASKLPNGSLPDLELRRLFERLLCANKRRTGRAKTTTVAARKVVLDSLPSEHLCGCSPAPLSPSPLSPSPTLLPLSAHWPGASHWLAPCCGSYVDGRELEERETFWRSSR